MNHPADLNKHDHLLEGLAGLLDQFIDFDGNIDRVLHMFTTIIPEIQFAGYAERVDQEQFRIVRVAGMQESAWNDTTYSIGEGYLGQVALTESATHWTCLTHDPRIKFFATREVVPRHLYAYPIKTHNELRGVLFCGSALSIQDHRAVMHIGNLTGRLWGDWLTKRYLLEELDLQRSRLTILIEVAKVLTSVHDPKRIMFLLVDMTLNLVHHSKAALTMIRKPHDHSTVELVMRGFSKEQADQYSKYLAHKYWRQAPEAYPSFTEYSDDAKYLDCVLTVGGEAIGLLGVELSQADRYPNVYRELIATLAYMGSAALEYRGKHAEQADQKVKLLHHLIQRWDNSGYERAVACSRMAAEYGKYIQWDEERIRLISQAGRLIDYDPPILREAEIPRDIVQLIEEYHHLRETEVGERSYSDTAEVLYLIAQYVMHRKPVSDHPHIASAARSSFGGFLEYYEKKQAEIRVTIEEDIKPLQPPVDLGNVASLAALSPREREVLQLIAAGKNNKEIAQSLYISENTVKNHITSIFNKTGVTDRIQLMTKVIYNQ